MPVPGGPKSSTPLGILAPIAWNLRRGLEELLDLLQLGHRLVGPGDVGEGHLGLVLAGRPGLGLAELHDPRPAALHGVEDEEEPAEEKHDGQVVEQETDQHDGLDLADAETLTVAPDVWVSVVVSGSV